ncbi:hypothetical protein ACLOAV_009639 [Pseudogymnoascus australis]
MTAPSSGGVCAGAIVPLDGKLVPDNGCGNPENFEVLLVVDRGGEFSIIEDPRDDIVKTENGIVDQEPRIAKIQYKQDSGQLRATVRGGVWSFRFLSMAEIPSSFKVTVNGSDISDADINVENYPLVPSMVVRFQPLADSENELIIDMGPSPQLSVLDHSSRISDLLRIYETEFEIKDRIWALVASRPPGISPTAKDYGLASLRLEKAPLFLFK